MKIKKILCPIEIERESEILISSSLFLAKSLKAKLYLLNVVEKIETPLVKILGYEEKVEKFLKEEGEKREKEMNNKIEELKKEKIEVEGKIRYGKASAQIIEFAEEIKPDLIIMGTQTTYGIESYFIGSTTWRVIESKKFPVLTTRVKIEKKPEVILVPVDLSPISFQAVSYANIMKEIFDSKIYFLHVLVILESMAKWEAAEKMEEEIKKKIGQEKKISGEIIIEKSPDAASGILKACKDIKADMIIMTTHGRGGIEKALFGSIAERIIRESEVPVLSLPPLA